MELTTHTPSSTEVKERVSYTSTPPSRPSLPFPYLYSKNDDTEKQMERRNTWEWKQVFKEFNQLSSLRHKFWELFLAQTLVYAVEDPNFSQKDMLFFHYCQNIWIFSWADLGNIHVTISNPYRSVCFFI